MTDSQVQPSDKKSSGVLAAGLALFSMFFGAGDLIWPLILGGSSGDKNFFAMTGLLITGVSLPLLGLISILLFKGDYRNFFGRIGKIPGFVLLFLIQAILGPIGSIPRLFTLSYVSLKPYLPDISLAVFSVLASLLVFFLSYKKQRIVTIVGLILTPLLLLNLSAILILGLWHAPEAQNLGLAPKEAFFKGASIGYNTLDVIASFIFAPLVLSHFQSKNGKNTSSFATKKMLKASLLAATLLSGMYIGLTYVASYYMPYLPPHAPEERLAAVSFYLLGPLGGFFSCMSAALACLTTAIPIVSVCSEYIKEDLLKNRCGLAVPMVITLTLSALIANLGFLGITQMLSPVLQILCPGLIVLCVLNCLYKLFGFEVSRVPVYTAFALSTLGYFLF